VLACINTVLANKLAHEALTENCIKELAGFSSCRSEVPYGDAGSRVDFVLEFADCKAYVEVKHVILKYARRRGQFFRCANQARTKTFV